MLETKHLTVMFTDIKGFTARTSSSTRQDLINLLKTHEELILPVVKEYNGTVIKTIGDAFLITFESPTNAVLAGVKIQEVLNDYNRKVNDQPSIEIRIAINSGEVTYINNDVFGETVNIASRIEGIAEPGEVYFTESVYLSMNKKEVPSSEIGYRFLKGITDKIKVYKVLKELPVGQQEKITVINNPPQNQKETSEQNLKESSVSPKKSEDENSSLTLNNFDLGFEKKYLLDRFFALSVDLLLFSFILVPLINLIIPEYKVFRPKPEISVNLGNKIEISTTKPVKNQPPKNGTHKIDLFKGIDIDLKQEEKDSLTVKFSKNKDRPQVEIKVPQNIANIEEEEPVDEEEEEEKNYYMQYPASNKFLRYLFWVIYTTLMVFYSGATIGKSLMRLKIIPIKNPQAKISFKQALIRSTFSLVSALIILIGYICVLWDKKNQTWHDRIAETRVVKLN